MFLLTLIPISLFKISGLFLIGLWLSFGSVFFESYFKGLFRVRGDRVPYKIVYSFSCESSSASSGSSKFTKEKV